MKWIKASEKLPMHQEEVLIRLNGIIHLAVYDQPTKKFVCKQEAFDETDRITWLALTYTVDGNSK